MSERVDTEFTQLLDTFIDGDLEHSQRQLLLARAAEDPALGAELASAIELQQALSGMPRLKASASLTRKLHKIPRRESRWFSRWVLRPRSAFAAILVMSLIGGHELYQQQQHQLAQQAELAQAKQDLALVLAYLEKVNRSANTQIQVTVNEATARPVARITTKTLQNQLQPRQEFEL
ncbi:MAG: hypothetical protein V7720_10695 [Halioglobus sp.]